ncbi:FxLYD domain-containing protein [Leucobacter ruminantium]|uniref:DUF4190 domain-containing protein n=1 Tax=Leucobacter ruminantium TaxID=1289170 RepID=A0A939RX86_9MICO|nr:FxLYD domain-containing protein [Leucobacter ruminantium]MBO1805852.1 hypothetical protein [Leucobacter ruminantium]
MSTPTGEQPTNVQPTYAPPQPQYAPPQPPSAPKGLAITALVVGIVAFLLGLVPVLGIILGLTGVVFGIIALVKRQSKAFALTGLILAALALVASCFTTAGLGAAVDSVAKEAASSQASEPSEAGASEPAAEPTPAEEPQPEPKERLTLDEGWTVAPDEYGFSTVVSGYVSNNSDKAITNYVQITFDSYDAAGANLGTCLANTNTIDANGKWKFEAHCLDTNGEIAEVRFKEITGF